jgi:large subunit ribosomal protein L46
MLTVYSDTSRICLQCSRGSRPIALAQRRLYSEAQAATSQTSPIDLPPTPIAPSAASVGKVAPKANSPPNAYRILSGIILTRAPLLTREVSPFEASFFQYQKRLNERLTAPFRKGLYYKTDTAAELDWRIKIRERHGVAGKDIGRYNPQGRLGWNDELLVDSPVSDPAAMVEKLVQDAEMRVSEDGEVIPVEDRVKIERPLPRKTEADLKNDTKRLDRALDQTLYLVVRKGKDGPWTFPAGDVPTNEALHEVRYIRLALQAL